MIPPACLGVEHCLYVRAMSCGGGTGGMPLSCSRRKLCRRVVYCQALALAAMLLAPRLSRSSRLGSTLLDCKVSGFGQPGLPCNLSAKIFDPKAMLGAETI